MWINRSTILSGSGHEYTISELALNDGTPTGTYGCSCPGWIGHGNCKHLKNRNLPSARESASSRYSRARSSTSADDAYTHLDYEREYEEVSDEQWNQIFRLVGEHELTLEAAEFLDKWAMKGVKGWSAASIIVWARRYAEKGSGLMAEVSDKEWDAIFRLVDDRVMSERDLKLLDRWVTRAHDVITPFVMIAWLRHLPARGADE